MIVNNAGAVIPMALAETSAEKVKGILAVNVLGRHCSQRRQYRISK